MSYTPTVVGATVDEVSRWIAKSYCVMYTYLMATVTISKVELNALKRKALLYEAVMRAVPKKRWGVERYTAKRIAEFMQADQVDAKTRTRLKALLNRKA